MFLRPLAPDDVELWWQVLAEVYKYLSENGVFLEGSLLKPSMTVPGADSKKPVKAEVLSSSSLHPIILLFPPLIPCHSLALLSNLIHWLLSLPSCRLGTWLPSKWVDGSLSPFCMYLWVHRRYRQIG